VARISQPRKAERLNHARQILRRTEDLPGAVAQMARDCAISPRQAYRYLEEARHLTGPVPVGDQKIAFTVKLPRGLVSKVRAYAQAKRQSLSELVSRALRAWLARR
jgi:predicted DNA-binding transcriptional regulator YafY